MENVSLYVCFTMRAFYLRGKWGYSLWHIFWSVLAIILPVYTMFCYTTNEKDGWLHRLREGCHSLHLRVDLQT